MSEYTPLTERSADELLKLHRATLAEVRRLEDEERRYGGYEYVPYRIRGELMYQREMLERYRAWGVAARTREIRALGIRAGIFTHTIPTSLEYARDNYDTRAASLCDERGGHAA